MRIHPDYNKYFSFNDSNIRKDWKGFSNLHLSREEYDVQPDLSIKSVTTWVDTAKKVAIVLMKIIIFPWGIYSGAKALFARITMAMVYPAQIIYSKKDVISLREGIKKGQNRINQNWVGREIVLEKEGHRYSGFLLGHKSNIENGKWALYAPGNNTIIENTVFAGVVNEYFETGFNLLLVNGPGVGDNNGWATADRMGDAQQLGLTFLESAVKAKKIVFSGHSLGGAAIGLAALKHEFKSDIQYLAIRMMTFSKLSSIAKSLAGSLASRIISWTGSEMDSIEASRKLQKEGIAEIIIQAKSDHIIDPHGLLYALEREKLMENKKGIIMPHSDHNAIPFDQVKKEIGEWDLSHNESLTG